MAFVAVRAVESIVNRGLSVKLFLLLTSLQIPNFLTQILPISLFIAVLYVYTRLNSDREIVVAPRGPESVGLGKTGYCFEPFVMFSLFSYPLGYPCILQKHFETYSGIFAIAWPTSC